MYSEIQTTKRSLVKKIRNLRIAAAIELFVCCLLASSIVWVHFLPDNCINPLNASEPDRQIFDLKLEKLQYMKLCEFEWSDYPVVSPNCLMKEKYNVCKADTDIVMQFIRSESNKLTRRIWWHLYLQFRQVCFNDNNLHYFLKNKYIT